jgi:predicted regulator of Ras-like GTPase activity (Roadblock/LC7/MglB family)
MKAGLQEINELVGIWGSLIINNQGEIITTITPSGLEKAALTNISNHVLALLSSASEKVTGLSEIVLHYENKKTFVLDLEQAVLVVLCTPSVDISLLRLTVNVVAANWQDDPKVQKVFNDNYVERI